MSNVDPESNSPPDQLKLNFGGPVRVVVMTVLIFVLTQVVALLISAGLAGIFTTQPISEAIDNSITIEFAYILIAEATILGSVYLVLKRRKLGFRHIGFGRRPSWHDLGVALLAFVGFIFSLVVITAVLKALWHGYDTDQLQDVGFKTVTSNAAKLVAFISLVVLPPIGEETLMRGYLFSGLRSKWSFVAAGLFTSLFFGAAHLLTGQSGLLWAAGIDTFVLSLFLVYLREKTGALYAGMGLHALNNVLAFFVYFHS
jgi:membrane protease YdiL (CAAX protease family)